LLDEFLLYLIASIAGDCALGWRKKTGAGEIARALPAILPSTPLDEPFAGIDPIAVGEIEDRRAI